MVKLLNPWGFKNGFVELRPMNQGAYWGIIATAERMDQNA